LEEEQDNGFLLVIDGVRKEKERLTAAKISLDEREILTCAFGKLLPQDLQES